MLNKLRCHTHFQLSAHQIAWSRLLIQIHTLNHKQCRRSQLIWIYTVCKGRAYLWPAGPGWMGVLLASLFVDSASGEIFLQCFYFFFNQWNFSQIVFCLLVIFPCKVFCQPKPIWPKTRSTEPKFQGHLSQIPCPLGVEEIIRKESATHSYRAFVSLWYISERWQLSYSQDTSKKRRAMANL